MAGDILKIVERVLEGEQVHRAPTLSDAVALAKWVKDAAFYLDRASAVPSHDCDVQQVVGVLMGLLGLTTRAQS